MIGLTWGDLDLRLTVVQWAAVILNCGLWLLVWQGTCSRYRGALLSCGLLFGSFWNVPVGRDTQLLFEAGQHIYALHLTFADFLGIAHKYAYLEYQTPIYPFLVSRMPWIWAHQLLLIPCALAAILGLFALFGRNAALLCATPLFALMIQQPSTDIWLFFGLLISLRLVQLQHCCAGAVVYGLTWVIKPLTLLTFPLFAPLLGWWVLLSVGLWGGYILLSIQLMQGLHQFVFLLHQLFIRQRPGWGVPSPTWQIDALLWRLYKISRPALRALPVYLFPAHLRSWRWLGYVLFFIVLLGYGNIKYQLLTLLVIFPLQKNGVFPLSTRAQSGY